DDARSFRHENPPFQPHLALPPFFAPRTLHCPTGSELLHVPEVNEAFLRLIERSGDERVSEALPRPVDLATRGETPTRAQELFAAAEERKEFVAAALGRASQVAARGECPAGHGRSFRLRQARVFGKGQETRGA